jgi:hypothetical protein
MLKNMTWIVCNKRMKITDLNEKKCNKLIIIQLFQIECLRMFEHNCQIGSLSSGRGLKKVRSNSKGKTLFIVYV